MALPQQFISVHSHMSNQVPDPENCICFYTPSQHMGIWRREYSSNNEGNLLQSVAQGHMWDWNAGGGNRNGGWGVDFDGFGGEQYYAYLSSDSDGQYFDFSDAIDWNASTVHEDDGYPAMLQPANGANGLITWPTDAVTYGLWFKYVNSNNGTSTNLRQPIAGVRQSWPSTGSTTAGLYLDESDDKIKYVTCDSTGSFTVQNTFDYAFSTNTLYCVVFTFETNRTMKMYVDGTLEDTETAPNTSVSYLGFTIGTYKSTSSSVPTQGDYNYTNANWCGKIYKYAWWETSLSTANITKFYNYGASNDGHHA